MHVSQLTSWVTPFSRPSQSGTWVCGLTQIYPSLNMSRMFVKAASFNWEISEVLGSSWLMMHLCRLPMLLWVVGWTTVTHFSRVSPNLIFLDYSLHKTVQLELLQIRVNILGLLRYSGNSIGSLFSFAQSSNWLPWCTSLFILVSLNILLLLLTILDIVTVLPISSMYQNFNNQHIDNHVNVFCFTYLGSVVPYSPLWIRED